MKLSCALFPPLLALASGANLRDGLKTDTSTHERRMRETLAFFTPEVIGGAQPRDVFLDRDMPEVAHPAGDIFDGVLPPNEGNRRLFTAQILAEPRIEMGAESYEPLSGEETPSNNRVRKLDTTSPTVTLKNPNEDSVKTSTSVTFKAQIYDDSNSIAKVKFFLREKGSSSTWKKTFSGSSFASGTYKVNVNALTEGDWEYTFKAIDSAGNSEKPDFRPFSVNLSTTEPTAAPTTSPTTSPTNAPTDTLTSTPTAAPTKHEKIGVTFFHPSPDETVTLPVYFNFEATGTDIDLIYFATKDASGEITFYTVSDNSAGAFWTYLDETYLSEGSWEWGVYVKSEGSWTWWQQDDGTASLENYSQFEVLESYEPTCDTTVAQWTDNDTDLHRATGRLYFSFDDVTAYYCSGTLVEGSDDRSVILTAAHCILDDETGEFPVFSLFIPGQDDGGADNSDSSCENDPYGCFYPSFAVVSDEYASRGTLSNLNFDYGFYVAEGVATSEGDVLTPVAISFDGMTVGETGYALGYPTDYDPEFMYTAGEIQDSPLTEGYYIECSQLSGGASGGPWTQSDTSTGTMTVSAVTSWTWSSGDSAGAAPLHTGGAYCLYLAALSADLSSTESFVADCEAGGVSSEQA